MVVVVKVLHFCRKTLKYHTFRQIDLIVYLLFGNILPISLKCYIVCNFDFINNF